MTIIYRTTHLGEAKLRLALVAREKADLLVYRVGSMSLARGAAHWFITREKQSASLVVGFTSEGMSQLRICLVDTPDEARWQRPSQYRHFFE